MLINLNNKIIQGALAGTADVDFCLNAYKSKLFNGLTLGGFSLGIELLTVVQNMIHNGRKEFYWNLNEVINQIEVLLKEIDKNVVVFLNIRTNNFNDYREFLNELSQQIEENNFSKDSIILELNAHCQQKEIVQVGAGSALLENMNLLGKLITTTKKEEFISSIKVRISSDDEYQKIKKLIEFKPDIIHVDSYLKGIKGHYSIWIKKLRSAFDGFLIANNSLYDYDSIKSALAIADAVSISRPLLKHGWNNDLNLLEKLRKI